MMLAIVTFIGILCASLPAELRAFAELSHAQEYAAQHHEAQLPDNRNPFNPDFSSFYQQQKKSFASKAKTNIQRWIGRPTHSIWDKEIFNTLLESVTAQLKELPYSPHRFIDASYPQKYIIIGDLQGSFHSLMRIMRTLQAQNILDEKLSILNPDYTIIFLGDAIGRSAFNLETMTLILQLMQANKNNVFYLQGNHEAQHHWHNFLSMKHTLITKYPEYAMPMAIPLQQELDQFFALLPTALYLRYTDHYGAPSIVLLSHRGIEKCDKLDKSMRITTQIKCESKIYPHEIQDGLRLTIPECGATTWTLLSPRTYYASADPSIADIFALLQVAPAGVDWSITLFRQNKIDQNQSLITYYNFMTGYPLSSAKVAAMLTAKSSFIPKPTTALIDHGDEIVIGATLNTDSPEGRNLRHGLALRIMHENKVNNGIHGKFIRLVMLNDKNSPTLTRDYFDRLLTFYKTNVLLCPEGTATLEACLDYVKSKKMLMLFPYSGANIFQQPTLPYIINYSTSYSAEAKKLTEYGINVLKKRRYAIFYQDDAFGDSTLNGALEALHAAGITDFLKTSYKRNTVKAKDEAEKINEYMPEVIILLSTLAPTIELIRNLNPTQLATTTFLTIHDLPDSLQGFMTQKGLTLISSRIIPNPTCPIEIAQEYMARIKADTPEIVPTDDSFSAYIFASLFIEVAKKMTGTITQEKLIEQFESIHAQDYKGLPLSFNPATRSLSTDDIWIDEGKGIWGCKGGNPELRDLHNAAVTLLQDQIMQHALKSVCA